MNARDEGWCRPSRVILAQGRVVGWEPTADAKGRVFSLPHLTKPDKDDPGATADRLQGRNITAGPKELNKMSNANEERIR